MVNRLPAELLQRSPLELYPYQKTWINDPARRKIATKSRRIGYSFGAGLEAVLACIEYPHNVIILSRGERQSKQFINESASPHCRAIGVTSQYLDGYLPDTEIRKQEIIFSNGSRIIALPANPDTARSYEGDVLLDEFGFHKDAAEIYRAIAPSITRGYKLGIISTPNGQQGSYYDLSVEAGLVDGLLKKSDRFSPHRTTIFDAIAAGFRDRFGNPIDAVEVRLDCLDDDMWLQEYNCVYLSIFSQWIPPALFQLNVDPNLGADVVYQIDTMPIERFKGRELYAGWDVARHKDMSVIWIFERVGDVLHTIGVIEMVKIPTPDQKREARRLMPFLQRLVIDKSGMGISIFEDLERDYGPYVEGVQFTQNTKEALAVAMKSRMEAVQTRIPDTDIIRHSFRSVQKIVTATGQNRFDAEHDEKYGHADHWWAAALANSGCTNSGVLGLVEYLKRLKRQQEEEALKKKSEPPPPLVTPLAAENAAAEAAKVQTPEDVAKVQTSTLIKPATNAQTDACPDCGSTTLQRIGGEKRCAQCGRQFGGNKPTVAVHSRKGLFK